MTSTEDTHPLPNKAYCFPSSTDEAQVQIGDTCDFLNILDTYQNHTTLPTLISIPVF